MRYHLKPIKIATIFFLIFLNFFNIYLFLRDKVRQREHEWGRGRVRGRHRIWSRRLTNWATQVPQLLFFFFLEMKITSVGKDVENSYTLLDALYIGAAAMENRTEVHLTIRNRTIIWSRDPVSRYVAKKNWRGTWVAQSVKHPTLDLRSGHDPTVCGIEPHIGL